MRGANQGEEIPLRAADLDALLTVVGDDSTTIKRRLVQLMGCAPEEASLLRRVLLRHRALTAGVGFAAGLSLVRARGPDYGRLDTAQRPQPVGRVRGCELQHAGQPCAAGS